MYADYWGLRGPVFRNAPGDGWFFESPVHDEALARLLFLVEMRRPCGILCGGEGTGKSIVLRRLAREARRNRRAVADVDLAGIDGHELLWRLSGRLVTVAALA